MSKTSKEEKPCTCIRGAQREQGCFRHILGDPPPFELLHKECHREARSSPWTLQKGGSLKSSTALKVHPVAITCERLNSPERSFRWKKKRNPEKPQSPEGRSRRPKKIRKPQWTPELVEGIQRLQEEFLLLRKGSFPSSSGKRVSLPLPPPWGGSSGTSKPRVF